LRIFRNAIIYCPSRIDGYPYYGSILEDLADRYPGHKIIGDFIVDLLRDSVASRSLVEHFESLSLSVVNREPTHFQSVGNLYDRSTNR
jgi:hypothetical protein